MTPTQPPAPNPSLFGFLGNVGRGVGDVVGGAVDLLGAGIHDVGRGIAQLVPGRQQFGIFNDQPGNEYSLDDVAANLTGWDFLSDTGQPVTSAVLEDLKTRYGPLLRGDFGEFGRQLYEQPVAFGLDALAIGSAGVGAAAKGGAAAIKGTAGAAKAAELTSALKGAGFGAKVAERAGIRAGLDDLAGGTSRTLMARALPQATYRRVGDVLKPTVTAMNPVRRVAFNAPLERAFSEPISALESRVATMRSGIESYLRDRGTSLADVGQVKTKVSKELARKVADYRVAKGLLDDAQAKGLPRLATNRMATSRVAQVARRMGGELNASFLLRREQRVRQVVATLRPWLTDHPEIARKAAGLWQRLDVDVPGYEKAGWAGRPLEWDALDAGKVLDPNAPPRPLLNELDPAMREAADPGLLGRVDEVVTSLRETQQRWTTDETLAAEGWDVADQVDSIDRLIDHLHTGVTRRVDAAHGAKIDPAVLAMDDMRLLNLEQARMLWERPGLLAPTQMLDRAYEAVRVKHGARFSDALDDFEGGPATKELDDLFRANDEAAPIYFPHMDPAELAPWDWFRGKRPVGGARLAEDPHLKRNRAKLLEQGSYVTDPMEAFSRRAARAVRAEETYRTLLAYATELGRPIMAADQLGTNEVLFAPEISRIAKRTSLRIQDLTDDLTSQGVTREEAVWSAAKDVSERNADEIADLVAAAEASGQQIKMWAVPKAAADRLGDAARYAGGFGPPGVQLFHDSLMQAWRQIVLFTRPAYVTNQFLGNSAFAILQGSGLKAPLEVLSRRLGEALRSKLGREIPDATLARLEDLPGFDELGHGLFGSLQHTYTPRNPAFAGSGVGRAVARAGQTRGARAARVWMEMERKMASEIDDAFRASGLVSAAERAMGIGAARRTFRTFHSMQTRIDKLLKGGFGDDPAVVREALEEAKRFFGDYGAMGAGERHVLRRYLFPWYGFTKHNLQLIMRFPVEYPGRAELMRSLSEATDEFRKQFGEIPEWLDQSVPLGPPGAEVNFLSMRGGSPFEGVFQPWTSQLAPLPKIALERTLGRSLFTDQPFTSEDIVTPFGSEQPYQVIRDEAGNPIDVAPFEGKVVPGLFEHLLRQLPPYSYAERAVAGDASTYDTATLLDLLRGQGIRRDETGAPLDQEGRAAVLASYLGMPTNVYGVGSFQKQRERERQAAITEAQRRYQP